MSKLIQINQFEIVSNKKLSSKSFILIQAIKLLQKRHQQKQIEFEDVIDPFELILACAEISKTIDKYKGNNNASNKSK